jgi:hypothetical protein
MDLTLKSRNAKPSCHTHQISCQLTHSLEEMCPSLLLQTPASRPPRSPWPGRDSLAILITLGAEQPPVQTASRELSLESSLMGEPPAEGKWEGGKEVPRGKGD